MARGTGKKVIPSNGLVKIREVPRRTRNQLSKDSHSDEMPHQKNDSDAKPQRGCGKTTRSSSYPKNSQVIDHPSSLKDKMLNHQNLSDSHEMSMICKTSTTCIITRKSSLSNSPGRVLSDSNLLGKPDTISQSKSYLNSSARIECKSADITEFKDNTSDKCTQFKNNTSDKCTQLSTYHRRLLPILFEVVLHINAVIYCLFSLSTNSFLKMTSTNVMSYRALDPVAVKVTHTIVLGLVGDFVSPLATLIVPQGICLLTGVLLCLQIFPQHLAAAACYFSQLNSSLIGIQLLLSLSTPSERFAAALSRINFIYCLADLFSPRLLKVANENLGFNFSYQVMGFSSALSLVGVLYLFCTNQSKVACINPENGLLKSSFMRLFLGIPLVLLTPRLKHLINNSGQLNHLGSTMTVVFAFQQTVMVPLLQCFIKPSKIITVAAILLSVLYILLMLTGESLVLPLHFFVLGLVSVVQNFVIASFVNSYPGIPGSMFAINLILHFSIKYFTTLIAEELVLPIVKESGFSQISFLKSTWKALLESAFGRTLIQYEYLHLNAIYLVCCIFSVILIFTSK